MNMAKKMNSPNSNSLASIKGWTWPQIHLGKSSYVSFSAFNPVTGRMKRKKIMLDRLKKRSEKRVYGEHLLKQITERLLSGWNPWVDDAQPMQYTSLEDVFERYRDFILRQFETNGKREQSVKSYLSYLHIFRQWAETRGLGYAFQIDRHNVAAFLDYVFVERNTTMQTRNNYAGWLKTFCHYMLERGYLENDPAQFIKQVGRRNYAKNREVLTDEDLTRVRQFLEARNRHFLLACYLLYYCFIRPHEMSLLRVRDISLKGQTVYIDGKVAKNHTDSVVTLPAHVARLMIDLEVFNSPGQYYLFSDGFCPGADGRSEKAFRDYWNRTVRTSLKLPKCYKFYSLKDTGITNMLRAQKDILSVKKQARHSSIAITDIYTPKRDMKGDEQLKDYEGLF